MTATPAIRRLNETSFWDAYESSRHDGPQLYTWADGTYLSHTWDDWRGAARSTAASLRSIGVERGARVAAVLTNTFDMTALVPGAWLAGSVVLSLPTLRRGMTAEEYVDQLRRICRHSEAQVLVVEQRFGDLLGDADLGLPVHSVESLAGDDELEEPLEPDELAFVQYSSGSTSEPKGCMLTMGAVSAQLEMLCDRLETDPSARGLTWLPLSHDMGLFGCLLVSWASGLTLVVGTPERFLRRPRSWFDDLSTFDSTMAVAPNFGLSLATRVARRSMPIGSVSSLRTMVLGGERIEWRTLAEAIEVLGPAGLRWDALCPAYGLAEATLSVTMKRQGDPPSALTVDRRELYDGHVRPRPEPSEDTVQLVSCGPPVEASSVRIDPGEGVGIVTIRSESLSTGYLGDDERTEAAFADGEFATADLGFMCGGELYLVGRADDVLVVGGVNVNARDAELAAERCDGVRPGSCVLVDLPDADPPRLVAVLEPAKDATEFGSIADEVAHSVYSLTSMRPAEVLFMSPGQLPKTPSGKIQRFRTRSMILDGASQLEARVEL